MKQQNILGKRRDTKRWMLNDIVVRVRKLRNRGQLLSTGKIEITDEVLPARLSADRRDGGFVGTWENYNSKYLCKILQQKYKIV